MICAKVSELASERTNKRIEERKSKREREKNCNENQVGEIKKTCFLLLETNKRLEATRKIKCTNIRTIEKRNGELKIHQTDHYFCVCIHRKKKSKEFIGETVLFFVDNVCLRLWPLCWLFIYFILSLHLFNQRNEYTYSMMISVDCVHAFLQIELWTMQHKNQCSLMKIIMKTNKQINKIVITERAFVRHEFNKKNSLFYDHNKPRF